MLLLAYSLVGSRLFLDHAVAQEVNHESKIEELSTKQWTLLVTRTSQALLGNPLNSIEYHDLLNAPPQSRQKRLQLAIMTWLQSDLFAKLQARDWCRDYFVVAQANSANVTEDNKLWDYSPHNRWLEDAIQSNMPFDSYVTCQLTGLTAQPFGGPMPQRLATASWYRARQFQIPDHVEISNVDSNRPRNSLRDSSTASPPTLQPFKTFQEPTPLGLSDLILGESTWLYQEAPDFRRNQLRTLTDAIASIRQSEIKDWELLIQDDTVRSWYQKQTTHPKPPRSERIFVWPSADQQIALRDNDGHRVTQSPLAMGSGGFADTVHGEIEDPLRRSQEWTVVLNCNFGHDLVTSSTSDPQRILTQRTRSSRTPAIVDAWSLRVSNPHELRLEIADGCLRVSLVHDHPISMIQVQTTEPIAIDSWTQIAVSYDATNRAHSLRVSLDGQYVGLNYLTDSLIRDFVVEDSLAPAEARSYELQFGGSTTSGHSWELEDIEVYRTVLSTPELRGLIENAPWQDWQDFSEPERLAWIEHYARRIDPHWRYERETLHYYLSNEYLIWESVPLTPILPAPTHLAQLRPDPSQFNDHHQPKDNQTKDNRENRIPNGDPVSHRHLFPWKIMDTESINQWIAAIGTEELRWDTLDAPWKESISRTEVARQWQHLIDRISLKTDESSEALPGIEQPGIQTTPRRLTELRLRSLAKRFIDRSWDRQAMMLDLLLSPEWIAIALDSVE